ncbi:MAG: STAS domain-containing protein, partial [Anaerolineales bacterium]|nr:STAS domain-containing protein [Anaerolineales bacterium]
PQLGVITIMGSLYFGAARHVEDQIRAHMNRYPEQRYLLLRMHRVNHCDISGIHMLETIVKLYRQHGGDVFMVGIRDAVWEKINLSDFDILLGVDHFLEQESAIIHIFNNVLNPAICVYQCPVRAWKECQSLPKSNLDEPLPSAMLIPPAIDTPEITPSEFWERLNDDDLKLPMIVDVREPEEFEEGHLRVAQLIPMPDLLEHYADYIPRDKEVIFVCRSGRRSAQVVNSLQRHGYEQVTSLAGGMIALELANLSRSPTSQHS